MRGPSLGGWLVILAVAVFGYQLAVPPAAPVKAGQPAPKLHLQEVSSAKKVEPHWKGQTTVLEFWASWCQVCVSKLRSSTARALDSRKQGVQHLLINLDRPSSVSSIKRFLSSMRIQPEAWSVHYRDAYGQGNSRFHIRVLPSVVLIDAKGQIKQFFQGTVPTSVLRAYIKQVRTTALPVPQGRLALAAAPPFVPTLTSMLSTMGSSR